MRITPDTNLIVRVLVDDDPRQSAIARAELNSAERIIVTLQTLAESVWVLSRVYRVPLADVGLGLRKILEGDTVVYDRPAVEAGLAMLEAGGDFADGVIAHEGRRLGADEFVSFDKAAVRLLARQGQPARLLA